MAMALQGWITGMPGGAVLATVSPSEYWKICGQIRKEEGEIEVMLDRLAREAHPDDYPRDGSEWQRIFHLGIDKQLERMRLAHTEMLKINDRKVKPSVSESTEDKQAELHELVQQIGKECGQTPDPFPESAPVSVLYGLKEVCPHSWLIIQSIRELSGAYMAHGTRIGLGVGEGASAAEFPEERFELHGENPDGTDAQSEGDV